MQMGPLGFPELIILLVVASIWLVPLAVLVWAVVTLQRIRTTQDEMRSRLDNIERSVQRVPTT